MWRHPDSRTASGLAAALLLAACSTGGLMRPLPTPVANGWSAQAGPEVVPPRADWWRALNDPTLDALVVHAVETSPNLQSAAAKVAQASAQMQISGAAVLPQHSIGGSLNQYRLPPEVAEKLKGIDPDIVLGRVQIGSQWELDLWGKARNAKRADAYGYLGAQAAYRAALVSLIGDLTAAYVDVRAAERRLAIAQQQAAIREAGLKLAKARHRDGTSDGGDPAQARALAGQQQAVVATLADAVTQGRAKVALLAGMPVQQAAPLLDTPAAIPAAGTATDPGLPRDLLRARPDVMQAELAARAQYARLKSAKASLYPSFALSGSLGLSATTIGKSSLSDIFSWDKRLITNGLSLTMPLFDHGRLAGQVEVQDAAFEQAIQAYMQAVLAAQHDVESALSQQRAAQASLTLLHGVASDMRRQVTLAEARYRRGTGTRQDLLTAQVNALAAEDAVAQAQGNAATAYVALQRALGLGAGVPGMPPMLSPDTRQRMEERTRWGERLSALSGGASAALAEAVK